MTLVQQTISLIIHGDALAYIRRIFNRAGSNEVGGAGRITRLPNGVLHLHSPTIYPQTVSGGSCDFGSSLQRWLRSWMTPDEYASPMPQVDFWLWHYHNTMGVFWSAQDEEWINNYVCAGMVASIVGNAAGEWKCRVDTVCNGVQFTRDADLTITYPEYAEIEAQADADYARDVTVYKPTSQPVTVVDKRYRKSYHSRSRTSDPHLDACLPSVLGFVRAADDAGAALRFYFTASGSVTVCDAGSGTFTSPATKAVRHHLQTRTGFDESTITQLVGSGLVLRLDANNNWIVANPGGFTSG